ncbi:MAG: polymerase III, subunit gamma and tau protein [Parcubacteria group bacterium GW2011_GWA1_49_26]|nr:MAG: DNA polymerase III, subunit gamma and tau, DNA polymerase III subunit gamma/tau [Candidatus Yanofskybacteria bacterium GW2011_GWC1_48_11]KKW04664.1 MAG: polymerase III, subunit gamma and tau protein [Parcubacteria group bacterium GW2011_GWB1_49_12]KKW09035.1 MAG: polymerase III, subunit gamma and tau protein [Parcubacteria group bacterium GW2011_GWA1_49_26]
MVLYRKYRPKSFSEVTGQEHIVETLKNAVAGNLLSHAYLFSGPRGSGKTTLARLLAKAANCESARGPTKGEPCNACSSCEEINRGRAIDLVEIDAASNRGIDEMRELRDSVAFVPAKLKYKVFVIDEAHQLTKEAANALLKTLEEPPAHVLFILATTEAHKMIPTIASRCQRFDFRKLTVPEISGKLAEVTKAEKASVNKEALQLIALNAGGSLRDALGLLDKVLTFYSILDTKEPIGAAVIKDLLGLVDINLVGEFVQLLADKKAGEAIDFLNKNLQAGMDPQEFSKNLVRYLRHTLVLSINPELSHIFESELTPEQLERMVQQASQFSKDLLPNIVENFMRAEQEMKYASIVQLPLELAIVESCAKGLPADKVGE